MLTKPFCSHKDQTERLKCENLPDPAVGQSIMPVILKLTFLIRCILVFVEVMITGRPPMARTRKWRVMAPARGLGMTSDTYTNENSDYDLRFSDGAGGFIGMRGGGPYDDFGVNGNQILILTILAFFSRDHLHHGALPSL